MNNTRLTFNSSTNFTLPIGVFHILQRDAYYYGFIKNTQPNVSGFLNNLIPTLSDYQENLFKELLKYNNGNAEIAKNCARSIHNVYLRPFSFHDDGTVNVPFRISKDKYDDFIVIHDERLGFYDTNFTNYVRTLLSEYASKTLGQREHLYAFKMVSSIREAIQKGAICKFYTNEETFAFTPISIELSPVYDHNYIVGINSNKQPKAVRLSKTHKLSVLEDKIKVTEEMCVLANDHIDKIYEEEYKSVRIKTLYKSENKKIRKR